MSTPSLINDRYSGFDSPGLPPAVANLASGPSSRGRSYYRSFYTGIGQSFTIRSALFPGRVKRGSRYGPSSSSAPKSP